MEDHNKNYNSDDSMNTKDINTVILRDDLKIQK